LNKEIKSLLHEYLQDKLTKEQNQVIEDKELQKQKELYEKQKSFKNKITK
jgi:hypothetical protein